MQEKHCPQMSNKKLRYYLTYLECRSFRLEPIVSPLARDRLPSCTCRVETKGRELKIEIEIERTYHKRLCYCGVTMSIDDYRAIYHG